MKFRAVSGTFVEGWGSRTEIGLGGWLGTARAWFNHLPVRLREMMKFRAVSGTVVESCGEQNRKTSWWVVTRCAGLVQPLASEAERNDEISCGVWHSCRGLWEQN